MREQRIEQQRSVNGTRWVLPRRSLGIWNNQGLTIAAIAIMVAGESVYDIAQAGMAIQQHLTNTPPGHGIIDDIIKMASEIPQVALAFALLMLGSALFHSRTIIALDDRQGAAQLRVRERVGILTFKRHLPTPIGPMHLFNASWSDLADSASDDESDDDQSEPVTALSEDEAASKRWTVLGAEHARRSNNRRTHDRLKGQGEFVAVLYPGETLIELRQILKDELSRLNLIEDPAPTVSVAREHQTTSPDTNPAPQTGTPARAPADLEPPPRDRPESSKAIVDRTSDQLSVELPAPGLWRGKGGALAFGTFWLLFTIAHSIFLVGGALSPRMWWLLFFLVPFYAIFYAVGIFMIGWGIHAGTNRTTIDVVGGQGGTLLIAEKSRIKGRVIEIEGDNIGSLRVGPSGTKVNDEPVLCLRIRLNEKVRVGNRKRRDRLKLWSERQDPELRWLAATLRHELGLPTEHDR